MLGGAPIVHNLAMASAWGSQFVTAVVGGLLIFVLMLVPFGLLVRRFGGRSLLLTTVLALGGFLRALLAPRLLPWLPQPGS